MKIVGWILILAILAFIMYRKRQIKTKDVVKSVNDDDDEPAPPPTPKKKEVKKKVKIEEEPVKSEDDE